MAGIRKGARNRGGLWKAERLFLSAWIAATDREIDRLMLVYDLYGLTEDEIVIVEAGKGCQEPFSSVEVAEREAGQ